MLDLRNVPYKHVYVLSVLGLSGRANGATEKAMQKTSSESDGSSMNSWLNFHHYKTENKINFKKIQAVLKMKVS